MSVNVLARDSTTGRLKEVLVPEVAAQGPLKNWVINGNMAICQRSPGGSISMVNNTLTYGLDRWACNFNGTGPAVVMSQQPFTAGQTAVPLEPNYFLRVAQSGTISAQTFSSLTQRIENVRTLAGQVSTLSFWAKADAARTVTLTLRQSFGAGGSADADVNNVATFNLTTTWQKFVVNYTWPSLSGKTIGTGNDHFIALIFNLPINTAWTCDFAQVQLESGQTANTFLVRSFDEELAACQRYYEKSFNYSVAPAQNTGSLVGAYIDTVRIAGATSYFIGTKGFCVSKRTAPTITYYNISAANAFARNTTRNTDSTATTTVGGGENSFAIQVTGLAAWTVGDTVSVHWTASAEL
jgi:hypothetical protein